MAPTPTRITFRSVLPHEPQPKEALGYLHIQGAFQPKLNRTKLDSVVDTDLNTKAHPYEYWATKEPLEQILLQSIRSMQPMNCPRSVHVLDASPPFTKIRVTFDNPQTAQRVQVSWRKQKFSPLQLFHNHHQQQQQQQTKLWQFSSHPCQVTQITTLPFIEPSWPKSNAPKFRRLLPRPGEPDNMDAERSNTRFVFLSGLLASGNGNTNPFGNASQQTIADAIRSVMEIYDTSNNGIEVFVNPKHLRYCHLGCRSNADAKRIIHTLQGRTVMWKLPFHSDDNNDNDNREASFQSITSDKIFCDYADITNRSYKKQLLPGVDKTKGEPPRSECTSSTKHIHIPGMVLLKDFVSSEEQDVLMAVLLGPHAPWAPSQTTQSRKGNVKRRVQHYGYVFDYETRDVLRDRSKYGADCPPLPIWNKHLNDLDTSNSLEEKLQTWAKEGRGWETLAGVVERARRFDFASELSSPLPKASSNLATLETATTIADMAMDTLIPPTNTVRFPDLNQLTVNEYPPSQGIGSHIDTPSAFGDGLMSISLHGGVVMEFRHSLEVNGTQQKKLVYLPPRSLLLLSGDARYKWEHMIVSRMTDTHNGTILPRRLRVSLTFRTALEAVLPKNSHTTTTVAADAMLPVALKRVESVDFPPTWGKQQSTTSTLDIPLRKYVDDDTKEHINNNTGVGHSTSVEVTKSLSRINFATPDTERDHVHAVYDAIATQWHHTRGKRGVLWPGATQFLQMLPTGSVVADVGCGDGKYFPAIWEAGSYVIGTDISFPLLQTSLGGSAAAAANYSGSTRSSSSSTVATVAVPESRHVSPNRQHLADRPSVAVADCMNVPLRTDSCDAAICIAVMHHLSTKERRIRCMEELARIVRVGGTVNIQAWAMEQDEDSKRKFAAPDVFVPFNAQPKYLNKVNTNVTTNRSANGEEKLSINDDETTDKSVAEMYSEAYEGAEFNERNGLVVFKRYCHLYRKGELEEIASFVPGITVSSTGYESGNYFIIFTVQ